MIYAGYIKKAATFLVDMVRSIGDIEQAGRWDLAQLDKASRDLVASLDAGIEELDPQIDGEIVEAEVDAHKATAALAEQIANIEQMNVLLDLRGYAGCVLIAIRLAEWAIDRLEFVVLIFAHGCGHRDLGRERAPTFGRAQGSDWMQDAVRFEDVERLDERHADVEPPPLACMPHPVDIKAISSHAVDAGERRIELLAAIVFHARSVALHEAVTSGRPCAMDIDHIVPLRRPDLRQEARLQNVAHEGLAGRDDGFLFHIVHRRRARGALPCLRTFPDHRRTTFRQYGIVLPQRGRRYDAALEGYSTDIVLIIVGHAPPISVPLWAHQEPPIPFLAWPRTVIIGFRTR